MPDDFSQLERRLRDDAPAWREHLVARHGASAAEVTPSRRMWRYLACAAMIGLMVSASAMWMNGGRATTGADAGPSSETALATGSDRADPAVISATSPEPSERPVLGGLENPLETEMRAIATDVRSLARSILPNCCG